MKRADLRRQAAIGPKPAEIEATRLILEKAQLNAALEAAHAAESVEAARAAIEAVRPDLAVEE